jgi:putative Ca2+/H+ antiporter (TMEM165/GDT1 family)
MRIKSCLLVGLDVMPHCSMCVLHASAAQEAEDEFAEAEEELAALDAKESKKDDGDGGTAKINGTVKANGIVKQQSVSGGKVGRPSSKGLSGAVAIMVKAFTIIFVAEWGDRSQISTIG